MKIGFVSLGCPKNLVDTEVMMGDLLAHGHELTAAPEDADVIVVNTCSFIDPAKEESVNTILEMAEFKKTGKAQRLVVAGCLVERYRDDIRTMLPEVDAVLGTNELEKIAPLCEGIEPKEAAAAPYLYHDLTPRVFTTPRHSAYVKVIEGCDHPCTFCVIPQYRGSFRSRRFESVVSEVTRMFAQGVREVNLIGQDTTSYGGDLGMKNGLAQLLARLAAIPTSQEAWVRFLYAYPNRVTTELLETIAAHEKLCKYIDIPLQHASAAVLKRMKRGSNGDLFLKLLERMRKTIPGVTIRTSMIVGFPGETDADFEELCQFVEAAQVDNLGVFRYSDEDTAKSYHLDGKVDSRTIYNRQRRLMALQRKISARRNRRMIGEELRVLVEGPSAETELLWEGRSMGQAPEIDGVVYLNDFNETEVRPGQIRLVRITEAHDYDLVGEVIDQPGKQHVPEQQVMFNILPSNGAGSKSSMSQRLKSGVQTPAKAGAQ
ncbi:MAG: 30S ribosomal protein S12 methylthiotransferase RimO [Bryobacterales bacterium]|nr:30S ribosomal protein S12 methylthiotransferase RimO [Bryobacterales bacterium]